MRVESEAENRAQPLGGYRLDIEASSPPQETAVYKSFLAEFLRKPDFNTEYERLKNNDAPCFQAVKEWADYVRYHQVPLAVNKLWLGFTYVDSVLGEGYDAQSFLVLSTAEPRSYLVIDVATYQYGIPQKQMPIVIGSLDFIRTTMSRRYSELTKKTHRLYRPPSG